MLDASLKTQLQEAFAAIENSIEFVVEPTHHADQSTLLEFLHELSSVHSRLSVRLEERPMTDAPPRFRIDRNGSPTGVAFTGIPLGHEFTSLVLAVLNADGKGKFPDDRILERIKNLKGPIHLRTFISLSCENCPDVIQALNLMAFVHPDFTHEMVDGAYLQGEIDALGVQGVPSVVAGKRLIHSGRILLVDLIAKLEAEFGVEPNAQSTSKLGTGAGANEKRHETRDLGHFDVAVIGGGPAGASAAIYSVRKGLKTAMIADKFGGQVQETKGIENMISIPYTEGPQLSAQLNQHIATYPVRVLEHRRVSTIDKNAKIIYMDSGETLSADAIIVATGAKWRELNVPGEKEYLGRGVAYCPHCDGPYYKGKKIAVVGGGNSGVEAAIDLAGIVSEVVVVEYNDQLKADAVLVNKLKALPNASILTSAKTLEVVGDGKKVVGLRYEDLITGKAQQLELDGVFVQIGLLPNSRFVQEVVETNRFGEIIVDAKGRTSARGIYAAGDVTTIPFKQIVIAMGDGAKVALAAFEDRMYGATSA
ncbi:MAG: alkyl hydroperoxide reductase subunit F [Bdellovibrionaceae bacterium]|nr:alkyl hydroperoxide reductase subunit F [Pseudobdellovibrionaceae bacterium]